MIAQRSHVPLNDQKERDEYLTNLILNSLVDLADSSILQARLQGTGAGHGIYGTQGQGQGGFNSVMYANSVLRRW